MSGSMLDRFTETYADFGLWSLVLLLIAVLLAALVNHFYFRHRLEAAVEAGRSPYATRLEALALALATGATIFAFSGWGFVWPAALLLLALVLAVAAGARWWALAICAAAVAVAVAVTILGLKINAL